MCCPCELGVGLGLCVQQSLCKALDVSSRRRPRWMAGEELYLKNSGHSTREEHGMAGLRRGRLGSLQWARHRHTQALYSATDSRVSGS